VVSTIVCGPLSGTPGVKSIALYTGVKGYALYTRLKLILVAERCLKSMLASSDQGTNPNHWHGIEPPAMLSLFSSNYSSSSTDSTESANRSTSSSSAQRQALREVSGDVP